ncbi:MAG: HypC/HybG/HupF family hydrogenase formation chaperone [Candidatus Diapherotrites archaeon]|nr:HypC/HybG/HupF family hydrogenase formation chaperone [Candidatus Diapherotrites archaeon]
MCLSVPGKVVGVEGKTVVVDVNGVPRRLESMVDVGAGDFVVVGMGFVMKRISEQDFDALSSTLFPDQCL